MSPVEYTRGIPRLCFFCRRVAFKWCELKAAHLGVRRERAGGAARVKLHFPCYVGDI